VTEACGGVLPGLIVEAVNQSGTTIDVVTDGRGRYVFPSLAAGTWTLSWLLMGFQPLHESIVLPEAGSVERDVRLAYSDERMPIANAAVTLSASGGVTTDPGRPCITDESGRSYVSVSSATRPRLSLSVTASDYRPYFRSDLKLTPNRPQTIDLSLQPK
jgi:hypothetical protein